MPNEKKFPAISRQVLPFDDGCFICRVEFLVAKLYLDGIVKRMSSQKLNILLAALTMSIGPAAQDE